MTRRLTPRWILPRRAALMALVHLACGALAACDGGTPTAPALLSLEVVDAQTALSPQAFATGADRLGFVVRVTNPGGSAVGPVRLDGEAVGGSSNDALAVRVSPAAIPTLNPGASAQVEVELRWPGAPPPGDYRLELRAFAEGVDPAVRSVPFRIDNPTERRIGSVEISLAAEVLQGEGIAEPVVVRDTLGAVLTDTPVAWTVVPADAVWAQHGVGFVALTPGPVTVIAQAGEVADTAHLVVRPRQRRLEVTLEANAGLDRRRTSDLWVQGGAAWTGTWGMRQTVDGPQSGDMLYSWRLTEGAPLLTDSLRLDARTVNDIKVHPTRPLAVATHEGSNDGRNGVTLLDIGDPHRPVFITRYTQGLASGVHNAWLDGDHLYLVLDGRGSGLRIVDISDPADPFVVASVYEGESFLHDVIVRDGLAFLSQWNDGLVIVDVGHGIAGGSPTRPVEVSRIVLDGETHNAWYWPERDLVVVGEEDFSAPGRISFIDVSDLRRPRRVGTWQLSGSTPHNVWVDEEAEVLWAAWYGNGLQALDLSGTPMGVMERTGRALASVRYAGGSGGCGEPATCSWAPQVHGGRIYVADMNHGIVVLRATEGS